MITFSATEIYSGVLTFISVFIFSSVVLKILAFLFPEDDKYSSKEDESKD